MLAKNLGWSQRRVVNEMGADEIIDWMAYELTQNPVWIEKMESVPQALDTEAEAAAIKKMLMGLQK